MINRIDIEHMKCRVSKKKQFKYKEVAKAVAGNANVVYYKYQSVCLGKDWDGENKSVVLRQE